jgi:hypothetical protein
VSAPPAPQAPTEHAMTRRLLIAPAGLLALLLSAGAPRAGEPPTAQTALPLAEARRLTRMMDDIYVTAVLTTHRMYAHEPGTAAAVAWGKQVIRQVNRKGWPEARIFGAPDKVLNPDNLPASDFERRALAAFKAGKKSHEETGGGAYRFATAIPVTERTCLNCHTRNKEGDLLGGVSYAQRLRAETIGKPPAR